MPEWVPLAFIKFSNFNSLRNKYFGFKFQIANTHTRLLCFRPIIWNVIRNCWCLIQFLGVGFVQGALLLCYKQCLKVVVLLTFSFPLPRLRRPLLRIFFGRLPSASSALFLRFGGILADCAARTILTSIKLLFGLDLSQELV
jgi:hypothetical protein